MKRIDFENGTVTNNILSAALPMLVAQILNLLYNIVDRIYIARIHDIGTTALGAVGLCFPIIMIITAFSNLFGSGGAPIFSINRGKGDSRTADMIMNTAFTMLCGSAAVLMLIGFLFARPLLTLFGASDDALVYAYPYLMIYLLGTLPSMIATGMNPFINAQGYSTIGMIYIKIKNIKKIIPVVAETYKLNDTAYAAPEGITELIDITNNLMPEGIRAAKKDIGKFKLSRKNALSQGLIASATLGGIAVGAIPIPFADAAILSPVEVGLVNGLASIYEIGKNEKSNNFINSIINVGTVSVVAKGALSAIKAIPGINIAASALNAIIAGLFVATIGETSKYLFEQVYLGEKTVEDIDWATKILESKLTNEMVDKFNKVVSKLNGKYDKDSIGEAIKEMFTK